MNHSQKRKFKGVLSSFMATTLAASLMPISHATEAEVEVTTEEVVEQQTLTTNFTDIAGHWGSEAILRWANYGVLTGRGDGTFDPNAPITRAEIAVVLSELMGYEVISDTYFADLNGWSEEFCRKLNAAGFMNGKLDNMMAPYDNVTREEFATILYQALHLDPQSFSYGSFSDSAQISNWAQTGVATLYHYGVTKGTGYDDSGKPIFSPQDSVTRAEVVQMLHSSINLYIKGADDVTPSLSKTTVIQTQGQDVTFSDTKVYGDLIIAEGTADGNVYLNNVEVIDGDLIIKGGGSDSIYLDNVVVNSGEIVVDRMKDLVRVVFSGNSVAPNINIGNNAIIVANDLGADGSLGTVTVNGGENVSVSGTFAELINKQDGVNLDISGIIDRIYMDASGYVNGSFVVAGTEFDSNSIPQSDVNITEPELTLDTDFGSAAGESPAGTAEILSTSFNESTSELTVEIEVRDIENCILMAEDANGVTVSNPSGAASLDRLSLDVTSSHKSSYSLYTVVIKMTQNYTTIPLSVNFKSVDDLAVPVITKNFNGISSASATVTLDDDIDYRTSTAYAYVTVSSIRNCELHYLDELAITSDQDEELTDLNVTLVDSDEDWAEYRIQYTYTDIDTLELDMNFLREGAEESVPNLSADYIHQDSDGEEGGGTATVTFESPDLDKFGNIVFDITVSDLDWCQLMGSTSRAITIDAESGDREAGYGQDFEVELSHDGKFSTYTVTFEPNGYAEDITFLVNLDDKDEGIPEISAITSLSRINDDDVIDDYFLINENTISISRNTVTLEVQVKNMDDLEGYKTPTKSSISSSPQYISNTTSVASTENMYVEKLDDELYSVSFSTVHQTDEEDSDIWDVELFLDLEVTSNYVALFAGTAKFDTSTALDEVPAENLPYAVKASSTTAADKDTYGDFERKITFSAVTGTNGIIKATTLYYINSEEQKVPTASDFELVTNEDETYTIYFTPQTGVSVNDVAFYIDGISTEETTDTDYHTPIVSISSESSGFTGTPDTSNVQVDSSTGEITVTITGISSNFSDYKLTVSESHTNVTEIDHTYSETTLTVTFKVAKTTSALNVPLTIVFEDASTPSALIEISTAGSTSTLYGAETSLSGNVENTNEIYTTSGTTLTFTSLPTLENYECIGFKIGDTEKRFIGGESEVVPESDLSISYETADLNEDGELILTPLFRKTVFEVTSNVNTSGDYLDIVLTGGGSDVSKYTYPMTVKFDSTVSNPTLSVGVPSHVTLDVSNEVTVTVLDNVTNSGTINVESGGTLEVPNSFVLTNAENAHITVENGGTFNVGTTADTTKQNLDNKGTITIKGKDGFITYDNVTNSGTITVGGEALTTSMRTTPSGFWINYESSAEGIQSTGKITIANDASLNIVSGTVTLKNGAELANAGTITVGTESTLKVDSGATLTAESDSTVKVAGELKNEGTIESETTIEVTGTLTNNGTLEGDGEITTEDGGTVDGTGDFKEETITIRPSGPAADLNDTNYDYATAYANAGLTFDASTNTVTVNSTKFAEWFATNDVTTNNEKLALTRDTSYWVGFQISNNVEADYVKVGNFKVTLSEDGEYSHDGHLILYGDIATTEGVVVTENKTWSATLTWYDAENNLLDVTSYAINRTTT